MSSRIVLFSGSINRRSKTRFNVDYISSLLQQHGLETTVWDPAERPLPIHEPDYHKHPDTNPDENVRWLVRQCREAAGFVWATPVYHNSFSGVLKNALDNLSIEQFAHKPIAIISNGGNAVQPCDHLRIVARGFNAVAIPAQVAVAPSVYESLSDTYRIMDPNIVQRFERLADELALYVQMLSPLYSRA